LGYAIQFARKEQVKDDKKMHEPSAHPFILREGFLGGDMTLESDLPVSGFGVGAGVTMLFVRFLETWRQAEIEKRLAEMLVT